MVFSHWYTWLSGALICLGLSMIPQRKTQPHSLQHGESQLPTGLRAHADAFSLRSAGMLRGLDRCRVAQLSIFSLFLPLSVSLTRLLRETRWTGCHETRTRRRLAATSPLTRPLSDSVRERRVRRKGSFGLNLNALSDHVVQWSPQALHNSLGASLYFGYG